MQPKFSDTVSACKEIGCDSVYICIYVYAYIYICMFIHVDSHC